MSGRARCRCLTARGTICTRKATTDGLCKQHHKKCGTAKDRRMLCEAITKTTQRRCKNLAKVGGTRCSRHQSATNIVHVRGQARRVPPPKPRTPESKPRFRAKPGGVANARRVVRVGTPTVRQPGGRRPTLVRYPSEIFPIQEPGKKVKSAPANRRCECPTKKGRCKNKARQGSIWCTKHKNCKAGKKYLDVNPRNIRGI